MCRFTRWCRTRFEIDDIREATAYCESNHCEGEDAAAKGGRRQGQGTTHEQEVALMVDNRTGLRMSPIIEEPVQTKAMRSRPSLGDEEAEDDDHQTDEQDPGREREREEEYDERSPSSWVTINPPHPPWDDNSLPDQPYQNPFYLLPIKNTLWLPMNPNDIPDLDVTVAMSMSLTSEPEAGRLGPLTEMVTGIGSILESGDEMSIYCPPLDGTEEIELTPTIASRVQNLRSDGGATTTDQQSDFLRMVRPRPRTSGSATSQSMYASMEEAGGSAAQPPTQNPPPERPSTNYMNPTDSVGQDSSSALPPPSSGSRVAQHPIIDHVSAKDVIQGALNEEKEALQQARAQRKHEVKKQKTPRSWWTSWAFRNTDETTGGHGT